METLWYCKQGNFPLIWDFSVCALSLKFNWKLVFSNGFLFLNSLPNSLFSCFDNSWDKLMESDFFFNLSHAAATSRLWLHSITSLLLKCMPFSLAPFRWLKTFTTFIYQHPWCCPIFRNGHSISTTHFLFFLWLSWPLHSFYFLTHT